MKSGKQVEVYLEELAQVLLDLGVQQPFHMLITGGAYMLLLNKRSFTEDVDFALVYTPPFIPQGNQIFEVLCMRAEVSGARSAIPFSQEFQQAVIIVAQRHRGLAKDWLNDEAASYYYDDAPQVAVTFWRSFGGMIYAYLPTLDYLFATKVAAFRPKDENDLKLLIKALRITTRAQAKAIVDRFLLPEAQAFWQVDDNLTILFPK